MNLSIEGEFSFTIPFDVVLLFESDLGKDSKKFKIQKRDFYNKLPEEERKYFNFRHKVCTERWNQIGGPEDVVIIGANAIDSLGNAAMMYGAPFGGPPGRIISGLMSECRNVIVAAGLEAGASRISVQMTVLAS